MLNYLMNLFCHEFTNIFEAINFIRMIINDDRIRFQSVKINLCIRC